MTRDDSIFAAFLFIRSCACSCLPMTKGLERILQEWFANAISTSDRFILGFYIKELYVKPINPKSSGRNNCVSPSRTGLSSGTKCRPFYKSRPRPNRIQSPSAGRSTGRSVTDPRKTEIHRNIFVAIRRVFHDPRLRAQGTDAGCGCFARLDPSKEAS